MFQKYAVKYSTYIGVVLGQKPVLKIEVNEYVVSW